MTIDELADKLRAAKSAAQEVLEAWPEEAYGFAGTLEQAVGLMGECGDELDRFADDVRERGSFDERRRCVHHGLVDCEACRERDLEAGER